MFEGTTCCVLNLNYILFIRRNGKQAPSEPLYLMYFEDAHFMSPHYQSIRPKVASIPQSQPPEQVIYEYIIQIFFEQCYYFKKYILY